MKRPKLVEVPFPEQFPPAGAGVIITMSIGQWDTLLQAAYDGGCLLMELDYRERPKHFYQKPAVVIS